MKAERIAALQTLLAAEPDDAFALYGLGVEYKLDGRIDEAEAVLRRLVAVAPDHCYGYYQLALVLIADDRAPEAAAVLREGVTQAEAVGESKAARELATLLDQIPR